jgi:transposase
MQTEFAPLSDAHWQSIQKMFNLQRKRRLDLRQVVDAIRHLTRTGTQWRNLPKCFPAWQSVYYYYRQWRDNGVLAKLLQTLVTLCRVHLGRAAQPSRVAVDSQSVHKVCFVGLDTGLDGHKLVNGRKRHLAVDSLGLPVALHVSAANAHDGQQGIELLPQLEACRPRLTLICADAAYGGDFQRAADWCGYRVEISQKPESVRGFVPQRGRWQVERSFGWLNFFRRLTRDYEHLAASHEAFVRWAFIDIILAKITT